MLDNEFEKLYFKLRRNYCKNLFESINENDDSLSPTESYCVEAICLLERPTMHSFANFVKISQPNATYRISNLINKGYVRKISSEGDRREYHLEVMDKFQEKYGPNSLYHTDFFKRIHEKFSDEEEKVLEKMIKKIVDEVMVE